MVREISIEEEAEEVEEVEGVEAEEEAEEVDKKEEEEVEGMIEEVGEIEIEVEVEAEGIEEIEEEEEVEAVVEVEEEAEAGEAIETDKDKILLIKITETILIETINNKTKRGKIKMINHLIKIGLKDQKKYKNQVDLTIKAKNSIKNPILANTLSLLENHYSKWFHKANNKEN